MCKNFTREHMIDRFAFQWNSPAIVVVVNDLACMIVTALFDVQTNISINLEHVFVGLAAAADIEQSTPVMLVE